MFRLTHTHVFDHNVFKYKCKMIQNVSLLFPCSVHCVSPLLKLNPHQQISSSDSPSVPPAPLSLSHSSAAVAPHVGRPLPAGVKQPFYCSSVQLETSKVTINELKIVS